MLLRLVSLAGKAVSKLFNGFFWLFSTQFISFLSQTQCDSGGQHQESPPTIQSMLEKALIQITKLERKELLLVGAGRTDAGVHAWGKISVSERSVQRFQSSTLGFLTIARCTATRYTATLSWTRSSVIGFYQCAYKMNACKMREAAEHFVGKHDFSAFANATREDGVPDPLKTISRFDVIQMGSIQRE